MNPIQKIFTKEDKVTDGFQYEFTVAEDGLYMIEIIASAKSWLQNLLRVKFGDDNLTLTIDGIEFRKLNNKKGLFDGEVAWNGNNLKGLQKTNVFVLYVSAGSHIIKFLVDKKPIVKSIRIYSVNGQIDYIPTDNNPAEDGESRQWITVTLLNLALQNIKINAVAKKYEGERDRDDLKLIIDGDIQFNEDISNKKYKYWYWAGNFLNGKEKEFNKNFSKPMGLHYIELWADRRPELKSINLDLGLPNQNVEDTKNSKRIPTVDDPKWTGDFDDDTEQMILARALWGEARNKSRKTKIGVAWSIKNRLGRSKKWDSYHHIILAPSQYSAFWEKPPDDSNVQALQAPLMHSYDTQKWKETYQIAAEVMSGSISDPTGGATHYYDDSIQAPFWATKENFIIKLENIFFHRL